MAASAMLASTNEVGDFINEYFEAWGGTDADRIMSYFSDDVTIEVPGGIMHGQRAVRDQFVHPFITGFPGNRHIAKSMVFGANVVVIEWKIEAEQKGPYAGLPASGARLDLPGCSVYELDPATRRITAGRLYFDIGTLLKQIGAA